MSGKVFKLVVIFKLKAGRTERLIELVNQNCEPMQQEANFIDITVLKDQDDPRTVMLYETWLDRGDFENVQMKRAYRRAYWEGLPELMREAQQVFFMDEVLSVQNQSHA